MSKIYLNTDTAALYLQSTEVEVYNWTFRISVFCTLTALGADVTIHADFYGTEICELVETFNLLLEFSSCFLSFPSISYRENRKNKV